MIHKFKSRKDLFFNAVIGTCIAMIFIINLIWVVQLYFTEHGESNQTSFYTGLVINTLVLLLLIWIYWGTHYRLTAENLSYRSGPFYGKIPVSSIREVIVGKTLWVGMRPATARNGLIVKYDKYEEIYITPQSNQDFVDALQTLHKEVKITNA